ncbi:tyrosine-type recombinase/integrase [Pseudaminobacter soli (ex Li et al. 2025)]|uniref:Site-specific integrase n=1 Tax=Pseudaminobacter soli (ex Li et al. 2025) TaxID=1295366 RepID=A0A2P7S030_9HYPH|nr:site-specific integrase [Mesorhizobium soli]PSJ55782.1 site-specific integrase [Mesorhizobium soli]
MAIRKRRWTTSKGEKREGWQLDYADQHGVRQRKSFDTKADAVAFETTVRVEVRDGTHVAPNKDITLKDAADIWIKAVKAGRGERPPAERSTVRQYEYHRDTYLVPMLGTVKLGQLNQARVMAFRDELLEKLSRSLAKKVLASLKGILSEMRDRGKVVANHAAKVKIGAATRDDDGAAEVPAIADIKAILVKLDELSEPDGTPIGLVTSKAWSRRRVLLCTAIHTGMRASELRGLTWDAIDLSKGVIHVRQRADEWGVIGAPKSKAGRRSIPIPPALVAMLRQWKVACPPSELVFPSEEGRPQSLSNIYNRAWKPIQIAAGVCDPEKDEKGKVKLDKDGKPIMEPRHRFHDLRHFHASMLIADGANPKEVQVEMGHSSIQMTFDLYGSLFKDEDTERRQKARAGRLAEKLSGT